MSNSFFLFLLLHAILSYADFEELKLVSPKPPKEPLRKSDLSCLFLAKLNIKFKTDKPFFEGKINPSFPVDRVQKPYVMRQQEFRTEAEFEFFLKHGFVSRLRLNVSPERAETLETRVANDRELYLDAVNGQKKGLGYLSDAPPFAAPFVETTSDLGWFSGSTEFIGARVERLNFPASIIAKIKTGHGVSTKPLYKEGDLEGGVMFIGQIPVAEIESFMLCRKEGNTHKWFLYVNKDGAWDKSEVTDPDAYKTYINQTLKTAEHPLNILKLEQLIQKGRWPDSVITPAAAPNMKAIP
jgi:hypothetical protein